MPDCSSYSLPQPDPIGRRKGPERTKLAKPWAAHLPLSSRKTGNARFHVLSTSKPITKRLSDRRSMLSGSVSLSPTDSRAAETDASNTQLQSPAVSEWQLSPAAEADEDLADFTFEEGSTKMDATQLILND